MTTDGYRKESFGEWLEVSETYIKGLEGNDVDLDPAGPWGHIAAIFARLANTNDDVQESIYWTRDPDNATGVSATKLSGETGTYRRPATFGVASNVLLKGTEGTVIAASSKLTQGPDFLPPAGLEFLSTVPITITKTACRKLVLEADENSGAGFVYTITIDSTPYTYTTGVGEDQEDAIDDIITQLPSSSYTGTKIDTKTIEIVSVLDMNISWSVTFTKKELWAAGNFVANQTGPIPIPINSLTVIISTTAGWQTAINPVAGVPGENEETDAELLVRRKIELIKGKATESAMQTELIKVDNVSSVSVISNRTDATVDGQPKKSVESIIAGGDDDDVAQAIYENIAAGMEPFGRGGHSGTATDPSNGQSFTILFSRPTTTYAHIRYTRIANPEQVYPSDGDTQVKEATAAFATSRYQLGDDLVKTEFAIPFYSVPGSIMTKIEYAITAAPGDTPSWVETDTLAVGPSEVAAFDTSRIFII